MPTTPSLKNRLFAWSVHVFTASGIVAALLALIATAERNWREAAFWLLIALVIDAVDGTFARAARVKEILPGMDGKMIDAVVDFTTYAVIPAFFFYQARLAPPGWDLFCAALMLLAAALYYGKEGMIAESMHFVGFPVLWNVVVFFLFFIVGLPPAWNLIIVAFFAILHFVPIKYAYPSRATRLRRLTLAVSAAGLFSALWIIWDFPEKHPVLSGVTVGAAVYFMGLAVWETLEERRVKAGK